MTHDHHAHNMPSPPQDSSNPAPSMNMGGMSMDMDNGTMMKMFFHTGYNEYILFQDLYTKSVGEMVGACIVIFILAMLYEGLKVMREQMLRKANVKTRYHSMTIEPSLSRDTMIQEEHKTVEVRILSTSHFVQTLMHILQVTVSYCLMLLFMTYNIWMCVAIILGAGAGYFAFGWKRAIIVDINEHCH